MPVPEVPPSPVAGAPDGMVEPELDELVDVDDVVPEVPPGLACFVPVPLSEVVPPLAEVVPVAVVVPEPVVVPVAVVVPPVPVVVPVPFVVPEPVPVPFPVPEVVPLPVAVTATGIVVDVVVGEDAAVVVVVGEGAAVVVVVVVVDVVVGEGAAVVVVVVEGGVTAQVAMPTVLSSSVTAPVWANTLPVTAAPALSVIESRARMLPWNEVVAPKVAELPTVQKTLQACAEPMSTMELFAAVVSVDPAWKMKTALGSPPPLRVRVPLS